MIVSAFIYLYLLPDTTCHVYPNPGSHVLFVLYPATTCHLYPNPSNARQFGTLNLVVRGSSKESAEKDLSLTMDPVPQNILFYVLYMSV